jgi:succinyl-diaminopimelate desuccinylase
MPEDAADRVVAAVDELADEAVAFAADLIRFPTVNPPGEAYEPCAHAVGDRLESFGFDVEYLPADGRPEHTERTPRINVIGRRPGRAARPLVHLNGHLDVVPAGAGWTVDPFAALVRDGRIYGRGACDMKAGLAAAVFAVEAIRRTGIDLAGTVEVSGTVDEESGGLAGVAHLADIGRLSRERTDYVIIPEPLDVERVCIGHRGVYWFEVTTRGRIAHGSMPFLGRSAIDQMTAVLDVVRDELVPVLASRRTSVPVVPDAARQATININSIDGGQPIDAVQTPCVADLCRAVFDRRFLLEEPLDEVRGEIATLLERIAARTPEFRYELRDLLIVHPVRTPDESPLVRALTRGVRDVLGIEPALVASPGTYDHKHVARIAGVPHCAAYGPGRLALAHQPDEWCAIADLIAATKVLALTVLELTNGRSGTTIGACSPSSA